MAEITVEDEGVTQRPGAPTLGLLASPLNFQILQALADGPRKHPDVQRACGVAAQTTLRLHLKRLQELGALVRHQRDSFPGVVEYELTDAGRELLAVAATLESWLQSSPGEPMPLGGGGKSAIKALVEAWSTYMVRALAAKPATLTELDRAISTVNYPSLERRLAAMRLTGQIEAHERSYRGTPYGISEWGCRAVAPILVASRWEQRHLGHEAPRVATVDVEAAFLLVAPLLDLEDRVSGSCRMATTVPSGDEHDRAGVMIEVQDGRMASCTTCLDGYPDAWAVGSPATWLAAVIDRDVEGLELGGDDALALELLQGLHSALFEHAA